MVKFSAASGSILLASILNFNLAAATEVAGLTLDYRFYEGGNNQYNALISEFQSRGLALDFTFFPLNRLVREMTDNRELCAFPASAQFFAVAIENVNLEDLIQSDTIDLVSYRAIVRPGDAKITNAEQLDGLSIAAFNGIPNGPLLGQPERKFELTNTEETRVKMLYNNRVDAIFGFVPDVHLVVSDLGLEQPDSSDTIVIWGQGNGTHLVCHKTPENQQLIDAFNAELSRVKKSGLLREFLGPFADIQ